MIMFLVKLLMAFAAVAQVHSGSIWPESNLETGNISEELKFQWLLSYDSPDEAIKCIKIQRLSKPHSIVAEYPRSNPSAPPHYWFIRTAGKTVTVQFYIFDGLETEYVLIVDFFNASTQIPTSVATSNMHIRVLDSSVEYDGDVVHPPNTEKQEQLGYFVGIGVCFSLIFLLGVGLYVFRRWYYNRREIKRVVRRMSDTS